MSGKYPARSGCTNYGMPMHPSEITLAESLKENGYDTWFIGKWHLGSKQGEKPEDQGFDVNIGGGSEGQPGSYFWPYTRRRSRNEGTLTKHLKKGGKAGEYLTDRLGEEAVRLIVDEYCVCINMVENQASVTRHSYVHDDGIWGRAPATHHLEICWMDK